MRPASLLLAATASTVILSLPAATRGAEVQVNPVVILLSPAARSALVTVRNAGAEPVRFEVQVRAWDQSPAGEMLLSPTEDIVAFPPILTLAPGEERNLRIAATTPFGAVEKTYRVFVQELPPERPDAQPQVRVLSRIGLPVFLAAARPVARAEVDDLAVRGGKVSFRLRNTGTAHVRPSSVELMATGDGGAPLLQRSLDAWYVLAGGERRYEVELPAATCPRVREVSVTVDLGAEPLRARAAVGADACAR